MDWRGLLTVKSSRCYLTMTEIQPPTGFRVFGNSGSPLCGKTTLRKIFAAASCYLTGFVYLDMSDDVIEWHKDQNSHSPFRDAFMAAEESRKAGHLITDDLINQALYYHLHTCVVPRPDGLRHLWISGFPRKRRQVDALLKMDPGAIIGFINATRDEADQNRLRRIASGDNRDDDTPEAFAVRWSSYDKPGGTREEISEYGAHHPDRFTCVKFEWSLETKLRRFVNRMNVTPAERGSLVRQFNTAGSSARLLIEKIEGPRRQVAPVSAGSALQNHLRRQPHVTARRIAVPA